MAEKEVDQQFVEYIVKQLVTKPDKVHTERKIDELGVLIELTVDREDMGVIIGKEGKTAKAIRTLLRVLGAKNDARINLKIIEPEGGEVTKKEEKPEETTDDEVAEKPEQEEVAVEEENDEEDEAPMADLDI